MTEEAKIARAAYLREYRKNNREKIAAQQKRYREAHPDTIRAIRSRHYQKNKEHILEYQRQYRHQHSDRVKETNERYWERKAQEVQK